MIIAIIQRRNVVQCSAARVSEVLGVLHRNFLERLEAVSGKAGADHVKPTHTICAVLANNIFGIGPPLPDLNPPAEPVIVDPSFNAQLMDLRGFDGRLVLDGGDGDDEVTLSQVSATILGGFIELRGGAGNDTILGGPQADTIFAGDGDDVVDGDDGDDVIYGGPGADDLDGGDHDDLLRGGDGDDVIFGGVSWGAASPGHPLRRRRQRRAARQLR